MLDLCSPLQQFFPRVRPMEPTSASRPVKEPGYVSQIKWDGVRILAFVTADGVRLQNRGGGERTRQYPEFQILKEVVGSGEALIDGEAVALEAGYPRFSRIMERDSLQHENRIKRLSRHRPCTYCIFDLLFWRGEDLTGFPLNHRQDVLNEAFGSLQGEPTVYLNENYEDGELLFQQVSDRNLEGIVAKDIHSPYLIGRKSSSWRKVKPRRRQLSVVVGLAFRGGLVSSLLLGAYHDGELRYIGRAGSGLNTEMARELRKAGEILGVPEPLFVNPPCPGEVAWLRPFLTVEIEFMEWTENLKMRAPVVIGFSKSRPEEAIY
ncbi:MAG: hypothetical protein GX364_03830 [Firmicutes bacterium]|nr:hypothetical protein [Bacillota bacterium]